MHTVKKIQKLILSGGGMLLAASAVSAAERPNIVFILTDDQRWDSLSCTGNSVLKTPNIDQLAEKGTLFSNAFVTTSICMVSRASILTGQYARRHGVNDFFTTLSDQQMKQTYPVLLRASGYYTGFIGKWGIGDSVEATNLGADYFDYWAGVSHQGNYWHERTCNYVRHDGIHDKTNNVCDGPDGGPKVRFGKGGIKDPVHETTYITPEKVRSFLASRDPDKPFCLSISIKAPHNPYDYDPKFKPFYRDTPMPIRSNATVDAAEKMGYARQSLAADQGLGYAKNQELNGKFQGMIRDYYRMVAGVDDAVGQIIKTLKDTGTADNTVIIYTSDNGYLLAEHGLYGKWLPYEESIRVPMILYDPRSPTQQKCGESVLNIDVAPTILDLAGVKEPENMQGKSMIPLLKNPVPPTPFRTEWFYEHHFDAGGVIQPTEAVISGRWKYIKYLNHDDARSEELYDLSSDPYETNNLRDNPESMTDLNQLRSTRKVFGIKLK